MKATVVMVILGVACVGLGIGLVVRDRHAKSQQSEDAGQILELSNRVERVQTELIDVGQRKEAISSELKTRTTALASKARALEQTAAKLEETQAGLEQAEAMLRTERAQLQVAQREIDKRDRHIDELTTENLSLDQKAAELRNEIGSLETEISDTQARLVAAEGDREFLLQELKRLQAEKAELERQFNDLEVVRMQIRQLKEELALSRRLEWIRRGLMGRSPMKGGQLLKSGFKASTRPSSPQGDLNVEIRRDGGARVVPQDEVPE